MKLLLNIQEKQQPRKRSNHLSDKKQLLPVRQISQPYSPSACTQQTKGFLEVQVCASAQKRLWLFSNLEGNRQLAVVSFLLEQFIPS